MGLPLIALDECARRMPYLLLAIAGGLGGVLALGSPGILFFLINPRAGPLDFTSRSALAWEGIAFTIAASATVLYRLFLNRDICKSQGP